MYKYPVIIFEGIEASGKSTNIKNVSKYLKKINRKFIKIREPGGTKNAELIRKLILNKKSTFNPKTGLMHPSRLNDRKKITEEGEYNYVNLTLINLMLQIFGPLREDTLCIYLLIFQVICCSLGLIFPLLILPIPITPT